ncbi:MAG TPA: Fe-S cluster assembly protein SufB, partial [Candidatus Saccharimonadales bacterium]|nr:Fe-S cluster assembly protein SufB [Candidatus Saccharimonadales bacterium]
MNNQQVITNKYKYGFHKPEFSVFKTPKGLSREVVEAISHFKNEPDWMRHFRLNSLMTFEQKMVPTWGADLSGIDFDNLYYYISPTEKKFNDWADVPQDIKDTYDKIGIPQAERKFLAGVGAQYDSEVIYHNLKKKWEDQGVIFVDTDTAVQKYPDLVRQYFGTVIPAADNKFAALNSAVWSGGSFVYVPAGVHVTIPLQAYFRINAANMGQFERTLIIAEEGSYVHYVEGCFLAGALVRTDNGEKKIEEITIGDKVLTHKGRYRHVYNIMQRPYKGKIYTIEYYGDSKAKLQVTEEHPLFVCKREKKEYRNLAFKPQWLQANQVEVGDYLVYPILQKETVKDIKETKIIETLTLHTSSKIQNYKPQISVEIPFGNGLHVTKRVLNLELEPDFYRLIGYFLTEGHIDNEHYVTFTFHVSEKKYLEDVTNLLSKYFNKDVIKGKIRNNGQTLTLCSTIAARFLAREFGSTNITKNIPSWILESPEEHLRELIKAMWCGDGSYDEKIKLFRYSSVTKSLIHGFRDALLKIGIVASINSQKRNHPKQVMHNVIISRTSNELFSEIVNIKSTNGRSEGSPFYIDDKYLYVPVKSISVLEKEDMVYNFSVTEDESYVAEGVVSHNCTAPIYTTDSLHSAVVEIIVKKGARVRYTTIQNWSSNVYNLVTKRMLVEEEGFGEWIDGNIGSKVTMKYPSVILAGKGAKGEVLSLAFAGKGQHQDTGGKAIHLAPYTTSTITAKSVSMSGGRSSYRGMVKIINGAKGSKSFVRCDALLLDELSRSDTYPTN